MLSWVLFKKCFQTFIKLKLTKSVPQFFSIHISNCCPTRNPKTRSLFVHSYLVENKFWSSNLNWKGKGCYVSVRSPKPDSWLFFIACCEREELGTRKWERHINPTFVRKFRVVFSRYFRGSRYFRNSTVPSEFTTRKYVCWVPWFSQFTCSSTLSGQIHTWRN